MLRFATIKIAAACTLTVGVMTANAAEARADELLLKLRYQMESSFDSGRFHVLTRSRDHGFDGMRCDADGNLYGSTEEGRVMPYEAEIVRNVSLHARFNPGNGVKTTDKSKAFQSKKSDGETHTTVLPSNQ